MNILDTARPGVTMVAVLRRGGADSERVVITDIKVDVAVSTALLSGIPCTLWRGSEKNVRVMERATVPLHGVSQLEADVGRLLSMTVLPQTEIYHLK